MSGGAFVRRAFPLGMALVLTGSVVLLFASGRQWVSGSVTDPGLPAIRVSLTGHAVSGAATAFGLLGLAGAAAVALVRGRWRQVLAGLLCFSEIVAAVLVAQSVSGPAERVRAAAGTAAGTVSYSVSAWPYVALAAAMVVAVGAGLLALRPGRVPGGRGEPAAAAPRPEPDLWSALEQGDDPTA